MCGANHAYWHVDAFLNAVFRRWCDQIHRNVKVAIGAPVAGALYRRLAGICLRGGVHGCKAA